MDITIERVKELRDKTGISIMQCRKALDEAGGDMEKAMIILRKRGSDAAAKKSDRELGAGTVASYLHMGGSVGAMVLLSCETDFVSKNEEFKALAYDIAMQIAATSPTYLKKEDVTPEQAAKAAEVFAVEVEGKPEDMKAKILQGKIDAYFKDKVLMEQDFIKDPSMTVRGLIESAIQKFGENIVVSRFDRFSVQG